MFGALVFSREAADVVSRVAPADIQRIPVEINAPGEWEVVNVLKSVDCIDHDASIVHYYPPDHHEYPNKPNGIIKLMLDSSRISPDCHIFKVKNWRVATIVSETLKDALEEIDLVGVRFIKVT